MLVVPVGLVELVLSLVCYMRVERAVLKVRGVRSVRGVLVVFQRSFVATPFANLLLTFHSSSAVMIDEHFVRLAGDR
jgi:hypothetical protein